MTDLERRVAALEQRIDGNLLGDLGVDQSSMWIDNPDHIGAFVGAHPPDPVQGPNGELDTGLLCNGKYAGQIEPRDNSAQAFTTGLGNVAAFVDLRNNVPAAGSTLSDPVLDADGQWNVTWIGAEVFGNWYVCLTAGAGLGLDSDAFAVVIPQWTVLRWLATTAFTAGQVPVLSSGSFWYCVTGCTGIKPGSDADTGQWRLATLTDFAVPAYVNGYPQGSSVVVSGTTYVATASGGVTATPPSTGWTAITSGPVAYVAGTYAQGAVVIDSSGDYWIWPSATSTTTTPTSAHGWVELLADPSLAQAYNPTLYDQGNVVSYSGHNWVEINEDGDPGPPAAPNWEKLATLTAASSAVYDPNASYVPGSFMQESVLQLYSLDGPAELCPCSGAIVPPGTTTPPGPGGNPVPPSGGICNNGIGPPANLYDHITYASETAYELMMGQGTNVNLAPTCIQMTYMGFYAANTPLPGQNGGSLAVPVYYWFGSATWSDAAASGGSLTLWASLAVDCGGGTYLAAWPSVVNVYNTSFNTSTTTEATATVWIDAALSPSGSQSPLSSSNQAILEQLVNITPCLNIGGDKSPVAYTPATPTNYVSVPTTIAGALDMISSLLYTLNSGPIPINVSASNSTVTVSSSTPAVGTNITVTVTLKDANSHTVAGKLVTLSATGSSTGNGATAVTNSSGVATFTVSDLTAESVTYGATDTTDALAITATASATYSGGSTTITGTGTANAVSMSITVASTTGLSGGAAVVLHVVRTSDGAAFTINGTIPPFGIIGLTVNISSITIHSPGTSGDAFNTGGLLTY